MKAIKDCFWKILITKNNSCYFWVSYNDGSGLAVLQGHYRHTKTGAKKQWECFAKINGIKKWKYI